MKNSKILFLSFCLSLVCAVETASAQQNQGITFEDGVVAVKDLPKPTISDDLVLLNVPHIKQRPWHCVPTSAAMVIRYFGGNVGPDQLKKLAEAEKPIEERNVKFTLWNDLLPVMKTNSLDWKIKGYPKTIEGYENGLADLKASLRKDLPVLMDVHMGNGHTFVVIGFDDHQEKIYIRDPSLPGNQARVLTYDQIQRHWHNHRFGNNRSLFFTARLEKSDSNSEKRKGT